MIRAELDNTTDLTVFARTVRTEVLRTHHQRSCLMSTRVLIEVARFFGVPATPLPVRVLHMNTDAAQAFQQHLPHADWPPCAWSVGVEGTGKNGRYDDSNGWDGHLVAVTGGGHLVDTSADQLSRPERGMPLESFAAPTPPGWSQGTQTTSFQSQHTGNVLLYTPISGGQRWRLAADWAGNRSEAKRAAGAAIRILREQGYSITG